MNLYDISLPLSENLPIWPGDPSFSMTRSSSLAGGDDANVSELSLSVHTGTHIDAPCHFEADGMGIDQIPLDILIGPCRVFEMNEVQKGQQIDRSHLEQLDLEGVTRLLFKTQNSRWWVQKNPTFRKDFISLSSDGANYLVDHGIKLVGIDALSIEKFDNVGYPTHHSLLKNNVIILEGLNLNKVPAGDYELIALPIKLKGADGAPTRAILRK